MWPNRYWTWLRATRSVRPSADTAGESSGGRSFFSEAPAFVRLVREWLVGPTFGVTLVVHLELLAPEHGGRTGAIRSGYRPLCLMPRADGGQLLVGLCELELHDEIKPGEAGDGRLSFLVDVSDQVRSLVDIGTRFVLAEGPRPIGSAEVRGIE
jgi:hypothetical protein